MSMLDEVTATLTALQLEPADAAVGDKLLESLNATPKARGGFKAPPSKTGTLHHLRSAP